MLTTVLNNDLLEKYKEKLNAKAKNLGLKNAEELKEHMKEEIENKKKELDALDPLKQLEDYEKIQAAKSNKSNVIKTRGPISKDSLAAPFKTLSSYLDVEKIAELPRKEIEYIWRARFQNKENTFAAALDDVQFASLYANAFKNSQFILPLPRNEGYEMHFIQWSFVGPKTTHCMFTTVAEYKLHQEYAKPHTVLSFHQELAESKGVVLMNGTLESDAGLSMDEVQLLILNMQRFYGATKSAKDEKKVQMLRRFNSGDPNFDMDELIKEAIST